jgi:hypothetical protein
MASSARLAQVTALWRSWLEKRPLGIADGRFITIVTGRGGRKLLRQCSVRTGQFPCRDKHAAIEQKSTAIWFRWSVHEHASCDQTSASPEDITPNRSAQPLISIAAAECPLSGE